MTPSQYIKEQGLPSLKYVAGKIGKPPQTLQNWYNNNYPLFEVVVAGVYKLDVDSSLQNIQDQVDKIGTPLTENEQEMILGRHLLGRR